MNETGETTEELGKKIKNTLIMYWALIFVGVLSYYFSFIEYGFLITVGITFFCGLFAVLFAIAIKDVIARGRLLITLGVLLSFSSLIFVGILALIEIVIFGKRF
ncbi:hypothetical protein SAMN05421781_0391 [Marinococcus luteus]|uniref:Uncharacterized protein n=1 Tax=Marinococcus luteus TaxID=1122204 RepID=A0A1H2QN29_9BACI|nr:hypothetical protein [Marinococcus luteus]SDW08531.1 hypothetical protein SAMN05421781_0391 [Marinococcus luteus]